MKMDKNGLKWIKTARMALMAKIAKMAKIVKIAKNGQKWPKMLRKGLNCQKLLKLFEKCCAWLKWPKMAQNDLKKPNWP